MTDTVRHPIFARAFHRITPLMEREIGPRRDELLAGLSGQVVEVGAGNGANFAHYPDTVGEVIAFEPESYLRRNAARVAPSARVPVQVREGIAEDIPLEDESADAAVVSVVLCTVTDPRRAAAELRRVLKPGGELRFLEHIRSPNPRKARLQWSLDRPRLWPRLAGGCHCGRDTLATLQAAGLRIERASSFDLGPPWLHTNPYVLGRARTPRG